MNEPLKVPREDGLVNIYGSWLSTKPECLICGGESPLAKHIPKNSKYYRSTCSKECLSKLISKRSSDMVKSGRTKRVGNLFYGKKS